MKGLVQTLRRGSAVGVFGRPLRLGAVAALAVSISTGVSMADGRPSRIVSLGGSITEIIYALGGQDALVGADSSSRYPEAAGSLPKVGYQRQLSAEGLLALAPDLVICTEDAGPPVAIRQIRAAGIPVEIVPSEHSIEGARRKVRAVADLLGLEERGRELIGWIDADYAEARRLVESSGSTPAALFLYARGGSALNVAGTETAAHAMLALAGARNAVSGYAGYRPFTAEGAVAAGPDVVVAILDDPLLKEQRIRELWAMPGLAATPAGRARRAVFFDDLYLLGFGPRTGRAVLDLARALHGAGG